MTQNEANMKMLSKVVDVLYDSNNALNVWFGEYEDCDADSDEYKKMDSARRWVGELLLSKLNRMKHL